MPMPGPLRLVRNRYRLILAGLAAFVLVVGAFFFALRPDQRPAVLTGDAAFPDYSSGQPGINAANQVGIHLILTTRNPWIQGQSQELIPTVDATPGPGVASVDVVTLFLNLKQPALPHPKIVTGDLVLLEAAGPNRWVSVDGPLRIFPNQDVVGSDFFLSFAVSLNVQYTNGQSYGWGGWDPAVRIVSPEIVRDFSPVGWLLIAVGTTGVVLVAATWKSARRPTPLSR